MNFYYHVLLSIHYLLTRCFAKIYTGRLWFVHQDFAFNIEIESQDFLEVLLVDMYRDVNSR